jgi:hypothetical protein
MGACALAIALTAPTASANEGGDTIFLKSGGVVRGSVIEYDPAREVRVKLEDGEVRTIEASLVASVVVGTAPPASAPAPSGNAPEAPTAPLHVEAPPEVAILGRPDENHEWKVVCHAPCDRGLRVDWQYRAGGPGIKDSASFSLASTGHGVAVAVAPASKTGFILGIVGLAVGLNVGVVGLYLMLVESFVQSNGGSGDSGVTTAGAAIGVAGAALMVGGAFALFNNLSTQVTQTGQANEPLPGARLPTWHTAETRPEIAPPTAFTAPVWTLAF